MPSPLSAQLISTAKLLGAALGGLCIAIGLQYVAAWTEPTSSPPADNVGAPITTGPQAQEKSGTISINRWDSQYLAGYGTSANKRSIGGAYGWDREVLYINGFNDWANGVSIGGNTYINGTANIDDVYIRSSGEWVSELGGNGNDTGLVLGGVILGDVSNDAVASGYQTWRCDSTWGAGECNSGTSSRPGNIAYCTEGVLRRIHTDGRESSYLCISN